MSIKAIDNIKIKMTNKPTRNEQIISSSVFAIWALVPTVSI